MHNKPAILILSFIFLWALPINSVLADSAEFSKWDRQVNDAIKAYEKGRFNEALEQLGVAVEHTGEMESGLAERTQYYYAKSLVGAFHAAADEHNTDRLYELRSAYYQAVGYWKQTPEMACTELLQVPEHYINAAITFVNYVREHEVMEVVGNQLLQQAVYYADLSLVEKPSNYLAFDIRGQAYYDMRNERKALTDFKASLSLYKLYPPAKPDLMIAYVYYRIGLIYRYDLEDHEKGLAFTAQGLEALNDEWQKMKVRGYDVKDLALQRETEMDLVILELDLLLQNPELNDLTLTKFQAAADEYPDNYYIQLGYATVLETEDFNDAVTAYKNAIVTDPDQSAAYFNLGIFYVNASVLSYKMIEKAPSSSEAIIYQRQVEGYLREGQHWMEQALDIEPGNMETLDLLIQITGKLDDSDHQKYLELKEEMTGN